MIPGNAVRLPGLREAVAGRNPLPPPAQKKGWFKVNVVDRWKKLSDYILDKEHDKNWSDGVKLWTRSNSVIRNVNLLLKKFKPKVTDSDKSGVLKFFNTKEFGMAAGAVGFACTLIALPFSIKKGIETSIDMVNAFRTKDAKGGVSFGVDVITEIGNWVSSASAIGNGLQAFISPALLGSMSWVPIVGIVGTGLTIPSTIKSAVMAERTRRMKCQFKQMTKGMDTDKTFSTIRLHIKDNMKDRRIKCTFGRKPQWIHDKLERIEEIAKRELAADPQKADRREAALKLINQRITAYTVHQALSATIGSINLVASVFMFVPPLVIPGAILYGVSGSIAIARAIHSLVQRRHFRKTLEKLSTE